MRKVGLPLLDHSRSVSASWGKVKTVPGTALGRWIPGRLYGWLGQGGGHREAKGAAFPTLTQNQTNEEQLEGTRNGYNRRHEDTP